MFGSEGVFPALIQIVDKITAPTFSIFHNKDPITVASYLLCLTKPSTNRLNSREFLPGKLPNNTNPNLIIWRLKGPRSFRSVLTDNWSQDASCLSLLSIQCDGTQHQIAVLFRDASTAGTTCFFALDQFEQPTHRPGER